MALKGTRGATSGKACRRRSLCNLFLEAKTEGKATGKAWRQAGVIKRSDYAREEFEPSAIKHCVVWGVLVGMYASEEATLQAGDRGELTVVLNSSGRGPGTCTAFAFRRRFHESNARAGQRWRACRV